MIRKKIDQNYLRWLWCLVALIFGTVVNASEVSMSDVYAFAKLPVKEILKDSPVKEIERNDYWINIKNSHKPVTVMFYINEDKHSQNLATLYRYVAIDFSERILFCSYMVTLKGNPDKSTKDQVQKLYSLDKIPGVLFYDNDTGQMDLEHEHYEVPKFKSYKTPSLFLWKTYYSKVKKIIRVKILD